MTTRIRVARLDDDERARVRERHPFLDGQLIVLSLPDERTADEVRVVVEEADRRAGKAATDARDAVLAQLMRAVTPRLATGVSQAELEAAARRDILEQWQFVRAHEVARHAGSTGRNAAATASNWRRRGRIFGVEHEGRVLYPAFQFDRHGRPREWLRRVLAEFRGRHEDDWTIALWFGSPNGWLDDAAPVERLDDPDAVVDAARHEFDEVEL